MAGGDVVSVRRRLLPVVRYVLPALFLLAFAHEKLELNPVSRYERMADGLFY